MTHAELGHTTWDEMKKKEMPNYAAWAQKIPQLATTYGDETTTTLPFIRMMMCVPKMLDELLADDYLSYAEFSQAVGKGKLEKICSMCEAMDTIDLLKLVVNSNIRDMTQLTNWATKSNATPVTLKIPRTYAAAKINTTPATLQRCFSTPVTPSPPINSNNMPHDKWYKTKVSMSQ